MLTGALWLLREGWTVGLVSREAKARAEATVLVQAGNGGAGPGDVKEGPEMGRL